MLLLIGIALFLPQLYATPVNHTTRTHEAKSTYLAPEKIERIAQKLLKLTLNTTHVQTSHCIMHPDTALQKDRKIHFHFNVISDVFIDMPIFVVSLITRKNSNSISSPYCKIFINSIKIISKTID